MNLRKLAGIWYRRAVPKIFQGYLDCFRAGKYWKKDKVVFVHVPKSAGVSLSTSLYGRALGHIPFSQIKKYLGGSVSDYYCFSFIRDPYSRFFSAVNYARKNWNLIKGSPGLPSEEQLNGSLDDLVQQWLLGKSDEELNFIFKSQSFFVDGGDGVLELYPFDLISNAENILKKKAGVTIRLSRMNASDGGGG